MHMSDKIVPAGLTNQQLVELALAEDQEYRRLKKSGEYHRANSHARQRDVYLSMTDY